jgi:oligoribonuclease NrnB/cAMP/cGMP phosphodiesterase (DHH superfamily)
MLTWEFFHPDEHPPMLIRYIQDRDLWQWRLPDSREFSAGLMGVPHTFEAYSGCLRDSAVRSLVNTGSAIVGYIDREVERICKHAASRRLRAAPHLTCLVINSAILQSEIGDRLCQDADVGVIWHMDHGSSTWRVSMRSRMGVDVTEIARSFGGGGHARAAGFSLGPMAHIEDIFEDE